MEGLMAPSPYEVSKERGKYYMIGASAPLRKLLPFWYRENLGGSSK
jgi:hypothetical protein